MKVCVIGEGPIGLLVCLTLIYYKKKYFIEDLNITLYQRRQVFKRKHTVIISKSIVDKIKMMSDSDVLKKMVFNDLISINCIEKILYEFIDKKI